MTMSEGTGPRKEERQCADADGDHRFCYDEEPQSRHEHEEAAHNDDCRLGRESFRCWYRGAHRLLQMENQALRPRSRFDRCNGLVRSRRRVACRRQLWPNRAEEGCCPRRCPSPLTYLPCTAGMDRPLGRVGEQHTVLDVAAASSRDECQSLRPPCCDVETRCIPSTKTDRRHD
jgi:hypothetical protein